MIAEVNTFSLVGYTISLNLKLHIYWHVETCIDFEETFKHTVQIKLALKGVNFTDVVHVPFFLNESER